ncbi:MAG: hypothetical protein KDK70_22590, partial [Myxococcales bacterium]|nr:hypothetical protein [Myxococcales bacterium]
RTVIWLDERIVYGRADRSRANSEARPEGGTMAEGGGRGRRSPVPRRDPPGIEPTVGPFGAAVTLLAKRHQRCAIHLHSVRQEQGRAITPAGPQDRGSRHREQTRETMNKLILSTILLSTSTLTTGCDDADEPITRSIELRDDSGENTLTVLVTAEDEADFDDLDLEDLERLVGGGSLDQRDDDGESFDLPFQLDVVDEPSADGVELVLVAEGDDPMPRDSYSWTYDESSKDCVDVTRTTFWHKVYASIWYKADSTSNWTVLESEKSLGNNDTLTRCEPGSYALKVGVKARKDKHFSYSFYD